MDRSQKESVVTSLKQIFTNATLMVVTQHSGLTVSEATDLRRRMRDAGAIFRVTKNRLALRALEGTLCSGLASYFIGPTAIAYSFDTVAAAKVAVAYAQSNDKLVVLGGAMNEIMFDSAGIKTLATLPSLNELRSQLVSLIQAPATRFVGVLQAPVVKFTRVLSVRASQETV